MKIVFIAGPYTGDGTFEAIERNIREAEKYQIALANEPQPPRRRLYPLRTKVLS